MCLGTSAGRKWSRHPRSALLSGECFALSLEKKPLQTQRLEQHPPGSPVLCAPAGVHMILSRMRQCIETECDAKRISSSRQGHVRRRIFPVRRRTSVEKSPRRWRRGSRQHLCGRRVSVGNAPSYQHPLRTTSSRIRLVDGTSVTVLSSIQLHTHHAHTTYTETKGR